VNVTPRFFRAIVSSTTRINQRPGRRRFSQARRALHSHIALRPHNILLLRSKRAATSVGARVRTSTHVRRSVRLAVSDRAPRRLRRWWLRLKR